MRLRRDDVPEELRPLFDALQFELQRVGTTADELHRTLRCARWLHGLSVGLALALVIQLVVIGVRHIA